MINDEYVRFVRDRLKQEARDEVDMLEKSGVTQGERVRAPAVLMAMMQIHPAPRVVPEMGRLALRDFCRVVCDTRSRIQLVHLGNTLLETYVMMYVRIWRSQVSMSLELAAFGIRLAMQALTLDDTWTGGGGCVPDVYQLPLHMLTAWCENAPVRDTFEDMTHCVKTMQELHPLDVASTGCDAWRTWAAGILDTIVSTPKHDQERIPRACAPLALWEAHANLAYTTLLFALLHSSTRHDILHGSEAIARHAMTLHVWLATLLNGEQQTNARDELLKVFGSTDVHPALGWIPAAAIDEDTSTHLSKRRSMIEAVFGTQNIVQIRMLADGFRTLGRRCVSASCPTTATAASARAAYREYRVHMGHALILAAHVAEATIETTKTTPIHSSLAFARLWLPVCIGTRTLIVHGAVPPFDPQCHVRVLYLSLGTDDNVEETTEWMSTRFRWLHRLACVVSDRLHI